MLQVTVTKNLVNECVKKGFVLIEELAKHDKRGISRDEEYDFIL